MSANLTQSPQTASPVRKRVLIVGGSTRAAAWSAIRAGYQPICADLFADLDTRQIAEIIPVRDYPDSLPDDVSRVPADGWFYTGALENRPDLIERMDFATAPYGPLLGTSASALRKIRDPLWLAETQQMTGWPALAIRPAFEPPPADGTWMQKPLASAGGRSVSMWDGHCPETVEPRYFQKRCEGQPFSAIFCQTDAGVEFLGLNEPLMDVAQSQAPEPFSYCGSVTPWHPIDSVEVAELVRQVKSLAEIFAGEAGLRGMFGIDFIFDGTRPWVIEVNPRYTASVETLELSRGQSLVAASLSDARDVAFQHVNSRPGPPPSRFVAKQILYARESFTAPDLGIFGVVATAWDVPILADIPVPGTQIQATWPICTVLAEGVTREECFRRLADRVDTVWKMVNHRASEPAGPRQK